jgi:hypothetical protein
VGAERRASPGRAAACLAVLALLTAGCGSSGPAADHSAAGVRAASLQLVADIKARDYNAACEAFTDEALVSLNKEPRGCPATIPYFYLLLGGNLNRWYTGVLPYIQVHDGTAYFAGKVQARYEHGRWRLENDIW